MTKIEIIQEYLKRTTFKKVIKENFTFTGLESDILRRGEVIDIIFEKAGYPKNNKNIRLVTGILINFGAKASITMGKKNFRKMQFKLKIF